MVYAAMRNLPILNPDVIDLSHTLEVQNLLEVIHEDSLGTAKPIWPKWTGDEINGCSATASPSSGVS